MVHRPQDNSSASQEARGHTDPGAESWSGRTSGSTAAVTERLRPTDIDEVRKLLEEDHLGEEFASSLHDLLAEDQGPPAESNAGTLLDQLSTGHRLTDQLCAHRLRQRARFALTRILRSTEGEGHLTILFAGDPDTTEHAPPGTAATAPGNSAETTAPREDAASTPPDPPQEHIPHLPGQREPTLHGFFAELLPRADLLTVAASLDSTIPAERQESARALTAYLGLPALVSRTACGTLPFNRLERLLPKARTLSLAQLHMLDAFLEGLDPRLSLGRFLRAAQTFIDVLDHDRLTPAQARRRRRVILERRPDGTGTLTMEGPLLLLEALYQRLRGTAKAVLRSQLEALTLMLTEDEDGEGRTVPTSGHGSTCAALGFDPATVRAVDERTLDQLVFDLLAGSLPQTTTTVEEAPTAGAIGTSGSGPAGGRGDRAKAGTPAQRRHHIRVSCPTDGTWLRRQAGVNVTVPMSTLLRADDRPADLAGHTPLPAEFAREVAAASTVWYRILTDPATGVVLDERARTYAPDRATRVVVNTKWQTCSAPGCTMPATHTEFEHGVPFDHENPAEGGPTHPTNGHPMCRRCHGLKTAGVIGMERTGPDEIAWTLPLGVTSTTIAAPVDTGGPLTHAARGDADGDAASSANTIANSAASCENGSGAGRTRVECVTTGQESARIAAHALARLEAQEKQAAELQAAALTAAVELRTRRQRELEDRENRLGAAMRKAIAERQTARFETARVAREQEHAQALLAELEERTTRLENREDAVSSRERHAARVERDWWARTRDTHLRLRRAAAQQSAREESALLAHQEEFSRLLTRPGVCPHSDLGAELDRMRAEEATAEESRHTRAAPIRPGRVHGHEHPGAAGPRAQRTGVHAPTGDRPPQGPAGATCIDCEAEYAAHLLENDALTHDDIDDYLAEEALALAAEQEQEHRRAQARRRAEREAAIRAARVRELLSAQKSAEERSYVREGHRLGRERARAEHTRTLAALGPAGCCTEVAATDHDDQAAPSTGTEDPTGTKSDDAQHPAGGPSTTAVSHAAEWEAAREWVSRHGAAHTGRATASAMTSAAVTSHSHSGEDRRFESDGPPPF